MFAVAGPRHVLIGPDQRERGTGLPGHVEDAQRHAPGAGGLFDRAAGARPAYQREPLAELVVQRAAGAEPGMRQQRSRGRIGGDDRGAVDPDAQHQLQGMELGLLGPLDAFPGRLPRVFPGRVVRVEV
ncbi:MAG TPA: hypothetical protein VGI96_36120, partial [Streptosporangiaceae bacterium]